MGEWVDETLDKSATETSTGQSTLPAHRVEDQLAAISDKLDAMQKPIWWRIFGG